MDVRVFTEPQQGASYDTLVAMARAAGQAGFEGFFRSDHVLKMGNVDGLPGPTDAWVTLAGLARDTEDITLGTLVSPATFREPGLLAITVAQVDAMSGGRVELGLGAGWYAQEHSAYGLPFPDLATRFQRYEEQLAVVTGIWDTPEGETFEFSGRHYHLSDCPALPKPLRRPPVIVGGRGPRRTPRLAATYAAEYNQAFGPLDDFARQCGVVRAACEAVGRDPGDLVYSAGLVVCCGEDEAEIQRRAANIGRQVDELRANGLCGTPAEIVDRIAQWTQQGTERLYMQVLDLGDLDHVALLGAEVLPNL
jgi:F420-dependent oxidoreductase-like protein